MKDKICGAHDSIAAPMTNDVSSLMTKNFISMPENLTVKEAMQSLIKQSIEDNNINTIFVYDANEKYCGAIDIRDLLIANSMKSSETEKISSIATKEFPCVRDSEKIRDIVDMAKTFPKNLFPVLDEQGKIVGIVKTNSIIRVIEDVLSKEHANLGGLSDTEDLHESLFASMRKRLPWLVLLLFLGMVVSSVVGIFESIVADVAVIVCFQSLILDMCGNVGTQSLAVTIRILMDKNISFKTKFGFLLKEIRVGGTNGILLGALSFVFIGLYLHFMRGLPAEQAFMVSGSVSLALFLTMIIASILGVLTPMFFNMIHVDPAVASGPLITTVDDLVAVITYYGLAGMFLLKHIA